MKPTFLHHDRPLLTTMIQATNNERVLELMRLGAEDGTDAFGIQFCRLPAECRTEEQLRKIFAAAGDKPVYATDYRNHQDKSATYDELAGNLLTLARCGATLCDVMADYYDPQPCGQSNDPAAVAKQKELAKALHAEGAEVLFSAHLLDRFHDADEVVTLALQQQERGADIVKIVNQSADMAQQIENLRIATLLKEKLDVPYLYLAVGSCNILRRIGGQLGCCMYLCVQQRDEFATAAQPILKNVLEIQRNFI